MNSAPLHSAPLPRSSTRTSNPARHRHWLWPRRGRAGTDAGLPDRNMITGNATGGSGGINTAPAGPQHRRRRLAAAAPPSLKGVAGGGGVAVYGGGGQGGKGNTLGSGGNPALAASPTRRQRQGLQGPLEDVPCLRAQQRLHLRHLQLRPARRPSPARQGRRRTQDRPSGEVMDCRIVSTELKTP